MVWLGAILLFLLCDRSCTQSARKLNTTCCDLSAYLKKRININICKNANELDFIIVGS